MFACIHATEYGGEDEPLLVELARSFSPRVERTAPRAVILDLEGCERLFGPPDQTARAIQRRASTLDLSISIAIAPNPDAAFCAARSRPGITIILPGEEAKLLAPLPVALLGDPVFGIEEKRLAGIVEALEGWGIDSLGELARLPEAGVAARLGPEGVKLHRLARGARRRSLRLINPPAGFEESIELDYPLELLEPLSFILAMLLGRVCEKLAAESLATTEVRVALKLEDREVHERSLRLPLPTRNHRALTRLLVLDLELHPPAGPVIGLTVAAEAARPRSLQNGLFAPLAPEPDRLEVIIARLTRFIGEGRVGSAELIDTHRPDAFLMKRFNPGLGTKRRVKPGPAFRVLGFRVFRPPLPARVELTNGQPRRVWSFSDSTNEARLSSACAYRGGTGRRVRGDVIEAAGPWRTAGDWWTEDGWARDEWDVAVVRPRRGLSVAESPAVYRVYRDLERGGWFVEGSYD